MVRAFVVLLAYSLFVWTVGLVLVVGPVLAQLPVSYTGYMRVASQSAYTGMITAQRSALVSAVGSSIFTASAGSVAVRVVASAVGWPALGVIAGMTLAQLYYDQTKVAAIKSAAATPGSWTVPNGSAVISGYTCPGGAACSGSTYDHAVTLLCSATAPGTNWQFFTAEGSPVTCTYRHITGTGNGASQGASTPATAPQITAYVDGLPAGDPNSIESSASPVGSQITPTSATTTVLQPVPDTGLATTVIPATSVAPTDLVVNPNAIPPAGTEQTAMGTQETTGTSTKTTTTTTNPDGSVTDVSTQTDTDTATVSCTVGNHDERTMATILQAHLTTWQNVGILGTLNNLKGIIWPSALPTITFGPTALGTFTLNFATWSWAFDDIRAITIAVAGLYGVAIVFRGRASS